MTKTKTCIQHPDGSFLCVGEHIIPGQENESYSYWSNDIEEAFDFSHDGKFDGKRLAESDMFNNPGTYPDSCAIITQ